MKPAKKPRRQQRQRGDQSWPHSRRQPKKPAQKPLPRRGCPPWLTPGNPGNSGGKKGRSGRPPDEFKAALRAAASHDKVLRALERILADPEHPKWLDALRFATEHGYGRAAQPVEVPSGVRLIFDEPAEAPSA